MLYGIYATLCGVSKRQSSLSSNWLQQRDSIVFSHRIWNNNITLRRFRHRERQMEVDWGKVAVKLTSHIIRTTQKGTKFVQNISSKQLMPIVLDGAISSDREWVTLHMSRIASFFLFAVFKILSNNVSSLHALAYALYSFVVARNFLLRFSIFALHFVLYLYVV